MVAQSAVATLAVLAAVDAVLAERARLGTDRALRSKQLAVTLGGEENSWNKHTHSDVYEAEQTFYDPVMIFLFSVCAPPVTNHFGFYLLLLTSDRNPLRCPDCGN